MPLSDDERRRLREIERDLSADAPDLARKLAKGMALALHLRASTSGALTLVGCGIFILGATAHLGGVGALGAGLMTGSALAFVWRWIVDQERPGR